MVLTSGFNNPYFLSFVYLVLSATIRWGYREAWLTSLVVMLLFATATLIAIMSDHGDFDVQRFLIRGIYLTVLSLMIIWFGVHQHISGVLRNGEEVLETVGGGLEPPIVPLMSYAAERLGTRRVLFAWEEAEEPWLRVTTLADGAWQEEKLGPGEYPTLVSETLAGCAFLFDRKEGRVLYVADGEKRFVSGFSPVEPHFADRFNLKSGLAIPIESEWISGHLFALQMRNVSFDDLTLAGEIRTIFSRVLNRTSLLAATEEAASARARLLVSRDLHDSVAQFLAGLALKLEGIRRTAKESGDIDREVHELQRELAREQRDLRALIHDLRRPMGLYAGGDVIGDLAELARRLEQQWQVRCEVRSSASAIPVEPPLLHNVELLVREAVANAVRHGDAKQILVDIAAEEAILVLDITDDGHGFPVCGEFDDPELGRDAIGPRSLYERIHSLGGTLRLESGDKGSRLSITLPREKAMA